VDATIISAPSSTKNRRGTRDPEMRQTKKGNTWYFGMKVHEGTDTQGLVHSILTTDAAQSDIAQLSELIHGDERELYGDGAYWREEERRSFRDVGVRYRVIRRGHRAKPLNADWKRLNHKRSKVRAMGDHAFHVVKRLWGFSKVRYRGLAKNTARLHRVRAGEPLRGEASAAPPWGVVSQGAAFRGPRGSICGAIPLKTRRGRCQRSQVFHKIYRAASCSELPYARLPAQGAPFLRGCLSGTFLKVGP
jgi:hypothetical protein